jgi:hypothetical protein
LRIEYRKNVIISQPVYEDLYVAGGNITINAPIYGDLIIAGGTIVINDTVTNDILLAGGNIIFNGSVGDDIRCAGGTIRISKNVTGDVVAAGGKVIIDAGVSIGGLMVSGGDITVNGDVSGNVKGIFGHLYLNGNIGKDIDCRGGTISINGRVDGKSVLSASSITIGSQAVFNNDVRYWSDQDVLDFEKNIKNGKAIYDPSLRIRSEKWYFLGAASPFFFLWYLGIALLMILIFQYLFAATMKKAADAFFNQSLKSLAFGFLFFIGIPIAAVVAFITVVGVPVGLFLVFVYISLILLATVITAIIIANWLNNRYEKKWSYLRLAFAAFGIFVLLKLVSLTPVVGWIIMILLICISFGAILLSIPWKKRPGVVTQQANS